MLAKYCTTNHPPTVVPLYANPNLTPFELKMGKLMNPVGSKHTYQFWYFSCLSV